MIRSRVLIKLGGAALVADEVLEGVCAALKSLSPHCQVIVVHGGGPNINAELTRRGITWNFVNGQRVTTPEMMDVIETTLCGSVNRRLVRRFGAAGLPTLGFSGADQRTLLCTPAAEELGLVGAVRNVNVEWLEGVLRLPGSPIPVIAPVGVGLSGEAYNINADWAASAIAGALRVDQLIFLTDQDGILQDGQLLTALTPSRLRDLIESQVVTGGMLAKTQAVLHALNGGVGAVRIMNGKKFFDGFHSEIAGTWCWPEQKATTHEVPQHATI